MQTQIADGAWRLRTLLDGLVAVEQTISPALRSYRWRPLGRVELPAVWNWLEPSRAEWADMATRRDTLRISVIVAVKPGDEQLGLLEQYADLARTALDAQLTQDNPFGVRAAKRLGMNTLVEEIAGIPALALEFPIEAQLEHTLAP